MPQVFGNTQGLKPSELKAIERLARRRSERSRIVGLDLARELASLSEECGRNLGVLLDRGGRVKRVLVGDRQGVPLPEDLGPTPAPGRLRGLRLVRTDLGGGLSLSEEDRQAMLRHSFDALVRLLVDEFGDLLWVLPTVLDPSAIGRVEPEGRVLMDLPPMRQGQVGSEYPAELVALEEELRRHAMDLHEAAEGERCVLVGIRERSEEEERPRMEELGQLARSAFFDVVEIVMQHRERMDPRTLIGSGKVKDLSKTAVRVGASALLFDRELTGVQARNLEDRTGLSVLDRTELVLRIFERRARTRAAKIRVALARLRYQLPRLVGKGEGMSRIGRSGSAGMGTRGKGEPQLEMRRRQMRERIHRLEALLGKVQKQQENRRRHRRRSGLPVVALVGYTNAGKSSWLNALTEAEVLAEDLLFATLETTVRRTRLPGGQRILLSDTVGFLRDLPPGLMDAFRSTLEELAQADLLVHIVDLAERDWEEREEAVLETLKGLGADKVPRITLFNKADLVNEDGLRPLLREHEGHFVSVERREDRYLVRTWIEQALGLWTQPKPEEAR